MNALSLISSLVLLSGSCLAQNLETLRSEVAVTSEQSMPELGARGTVRYRSVSRAQWNEFWQRRSEDLAARARTWNSNVESFSHIADGLRQLPGKPDSTELVMRRELVAEDVAELLRKTKHVKSASFMDVADLQRSSALLKLIEAEIEADRRQLSAELREQAKLRHLADLADRKANEARHAFERARWAALVSREAVDLTVDEANHHSIWKDVAEWTLIVGLASLGSVGR